MFRIKLLAFAALIFSIAAASSDRTDTYDYVIVGGGVSGLTVANRLTELKDITVAVIEAGGSQHDNPNVTNPENFPGVLNDKAIVWSYPTVNQSAAGQKSYTLNGGKALGGGSVINGMTYTRTEDVQIDSWEQGLGNEGWSWKTLLYYYKKSETFQKPSPAAAAAGASYDPAVVGFEGPLKVGWSSGFSNSTFSHILNATNQNLGLPYVADMGSGHMRGYNVWPKTVDVKANVRGDAARQYYWPYRSRKNLFVMTYTLAHRIVWSSSHSSTNAVASGVEVTGADGKRRIIKAKREVILSAGSLKSPILLELSGIGNPEVLGEFDIPVKVPLKSVGEHLQDQPNSVIGYKLNGTNITGYPQYVSYVTPRDIFGKDTDHMGSLIEQEMAKEARLVASYSNGGVNASALETIFKVQHELLFKKNMPIAEILYAPMGNAMIVAFWPTQPFSRGRIHITANDIEAPAKIDPMYYMFPFDEHVDAAIAEYVRKIFATDPLNPYITVEVMPGFDRVPRGGKKGEWQKYLREQFTPNNHPVSTAAMYPKELGGVVDNELKVYGTSNVRVVDASVLPQQLVGHLTSTLYAIAERASDFIKRDMGKTR